MIVTIIAAMSRNRVIGAAGRIPWHLPEDLRRFRELTTGHPVIMGRKTFEAIGRPLPGRENIVLSRRRGYAPAGCRPAATLAEALRLAEPADEVFIGGGSDVYRQALPLARRIYLTIVDLEVPGDALFPEIPADFRETAREELAGTPAAVLITMEREPGQ